MAAQAQTAAPPPATPPPFPPVDERSVWLVGDTTPSSPTQTAQRLLDLVQRGGKPRDSYLTGGAVGELEARFAKMLGKEDCAFLGTGTLANHLAVRVLAGDASRVIVQHESHLYRDESDATQLLSGLNLVPLAEGRACPPLGQGHQVEGPARPWRRSRRRSTRPRTGPIRCGSARSRWKVRCGA
jgi:threonine aldolase